MLTSDRHGACLVQVDQLADMISTVFMVHSGSNLQSFSHLNTSLVVTAAELACNNFFMQVSSLSMLLAERLKLQDDVQQCLQQPV